VVLFSLAVHILVDVGFRCCPHLTKLK
jgi:hypothetical protein